MKHLVLAALVLGSSLALAQSDDRTAKASPHNVSINGGFSHGGFTFGAAYEHMIDNSTGIGGGFRMFNKDDEAPATNNTPGITIIGATLGNHFYKKAWDLSFQPSFNIMMIDALGAGDDTTTFGPGVSISLLTSITDRASVGFDFSNWWAWFSEDYQGMHVADLSAKFKFGF